MVNTNIKPNLLKPRWSKVFSDLWDDKIRTLLVVASIAVGVFAIGMIITASTVLGNDININYAATNPANIEIVTGPFHDDLVRVIGEVEGVEEVEGRRKVPVQARRGEENWQVLTLVAIDDFETTTINRLGDLEGQSIPEKGEMVISQSILNDTGFETEDTIEIKFSDGSIYTLTVAGTVIDQTSAKPNPAAGATAFITTDTLRLLQQEVYYSHMLVTVEGDGDDEAFIKQVAEDVEDRVESHQKVYQVKTHLSTEHPMTDTILALLGVLGALGGFVIILSSSLIINTLNALLTQQLRQIGVMKLVGGRSRQVLGMYLLLIFIYGVVALILAVPSGAIAGYALASMIANMTGSILEGFRFIPTVIIVQVVIAFVVPIGAGFVPVNKGAKTNVRRALSNDRPVSKLKKRSIIDPTTKWVRRIPRPILLSFRNTFRKKGRLVLTIFTLTVAGAVFIGVFNVRASLTDIIGQMTQHFMGDVTITFSQPHQVSSIERALNTIPGVESVEGWGGSTGEIWDENEDTVTDISIVAPPEGSQLVDTEIVAGRWLKPEDEQAIVISDSIYQYYPDLIPGDSITIKLPDEPEDEWVVVGVFRYVAVMGDPMAYTYFDTIANITDQQNQATSFRVVSAEHAPEFQRMLTRNVEKYLADRDYEVQSVQSGYLMRQQVADGLNTLVVFLLVMAVLIAVVGSIGLTGTMSMNVLERTREIGVMRSIGAIDKMVMQSVIIEGLVIGWITWVLAIGFSFPLSKFLLAIISNSMLDSAMTMEFTPIGILLWLVIVTILSVVASVMPARNAARLTINEVLAYE